MYSLFHLVYLILPVIAALFLVFGIKKKQNSIISMAVWISLLGLLLHYHISGGEILGHYFNYLHASIYTFNILVFLIAIIILLSNKEVESYLLKLSSNLLKAFIVVGVMIILTNLWINAYFIENRKAGTPIIQIAGMKKFNPCKSSNIAYYKVDKQGNIMYLCPSQFGLFPAIDKLDKVPAMIAKQLPADNQ